MYSHLFTYQSLWVQMVTFVNDCSCLPSIKSKQKWKAPWLPWLPWLPKEHQLPQIMLFPCDLLKVKSHQMPGFQNHVHHLNGHKLVSFQFRGIVFLCQTLTPENDRKICAPENLIFIRIYNLRPYFLGHSQPLHRRATPCLKHQASATEASRPAWSFRAATPSWSRQPADPQQKR